MLLTQCPCVFFTTCSSIHDHTDSHCFMKLLQGQLKETLFDWPEGKSHGDMVQKSQRILQENKVAYINGEENKKKAACVSQIYDEAPKSYCVKYAGTNILRAICSVPNDMRDVTQT